MTARSVTVESVPGDQWNETPESSSSQSPTDISKALPPKLNLISHDALSMNQLNQALVVRKQDKPSRSQPGPPAVHLTSSSAPPPLSSPRKHARNKNQNASLSPLPPPHSKASHTQQTHAHTHAHDAEEEKEEKQFGNHCNNNENEHQNSSMCVYDLTAFDTPMTTSTDDSDSDSDIEVIDTVIRRTRTSSSSSASTNRIDNVVGANGMDAFEQYTVNGIGGKLLRKAGWDGDTHSLAACKNRAVQESAKYASIQKRIRQHNGVGYATTTTTTSILQPPTHAQTQAQRRRLQIAFPTALSSSSASSSNNINMARLAAMHARRYNAQAAQLHRRVVSNTPGTAIVLPDSDDSESDDSDESVHVHDNEKNKKKKQKQKKKRPQPAQQITEASSASINTIDVLLGTDGEKHRSRKRYRQPPPPSSQQQQPQKKRARKAKARRVMNGDDDSADGESEEEVMFVDKGEVTRSRIRATPFTQIISQLQVFTERMTLAEIRGTFRDDNCSTSGGSKIPSVTRIVISMKDQYSQCRIATPVRGKFCHHLQPFDAKTFLMRPKKYQKCDTCNRQIAKHELVKCAYFERIFQEMRHCYDEEIEQIEIMHDGSYKPVIPKHLRNCNKRRSVSREGRVKDTAATAATAARQVFDIDDTSSGDDGGGGDVHTKSKKHSGVKSSSPKIIVLSSSEEDEDDNGQPTVVDLVDDDDSECNEKR